MLWPFVRVAARRVAPASSSSESLRRLGMHALTALVVRLRYCEHMVKGRVPSSGSRIAARAGQLRCPRMDNPLWQRSLQSRSKQGRRKGERRERRSLWMTAASAA